MSNSFILNPVFRRWDDVQNTHY